MDQEGGSPNQVTFCPNHHRLKWLASPLHLPLREYLDFVVVTFQPDQPSILQPSFPEFKRKTARYKLTTDEMVMAFWVLLDTDHFTAAAYLRFLVETHQHWGTGLIFSVGLNVCFTARIKLRVVVVALDCLRLARFTPALIPAATAGLRVLLEANPSPRLERLVKETLVSLEVGPLDLLD